MLTVAVALLFLAIFAAVLGSMMAGPVGLIAAAVLLAGFVGTLGVYLLRERGYSSRQPPSNGK